MPHREIDFDDICKQLEYIDRPMKLPQKIAVFYLPLSSLPLFAMSIDSKAGKVDIPSEDGASIDQDELQLVMP